MELSELADEVASLRETEEPESTFRILAIKLGQVARALHQIDSLEVGDDVTERRVEAVNRDMFAGMVIAAFEFAAEYDVDVERAIDERLDTMERIRSGEQSLGGDMGFEPETDELDPDEDRSFH